MVANDEYPLLFSVLKNGAHTLSALSLPDKNVAPFGAVRSTVSINAAVSPDSRWMAYQSSQTAGSRSTSNRTADWHHLSVRAARERCASRADVVARLQGALLQPACQKRSRGGHDRTEFDFGNPIALPGHSD